MAQYILYIFSTLVYWLTRSRDTVTSHHIQFHEPKTQNKSIHNVCVVCKCTLAHLLSIKHRELHNDLPTENQVRNRMAGYCSPTAMHISIVVDLA